ncbi:MAG: hypothetical protein ABDH49_02430 [Candidatus Hydrothermales bacterium]
MYFPKNGEILFSYYFIFTGTDKGILIVHFPFLIFGVLSSYSILRKLNISKEKSLYIFSILSIPIIPNITGCAHVDIETASIFLIFLNLLLLKFLFNIVFPLLSLSIGAGTKLSFLPIFGLFLLLLLLVLFLSFATSFHHYIYNFCLTGNPLYPYIIKIFGLEIFKGKVEVPKCLDLPVFTYDPLIIFKCLAELWHFDSNDFYTYDNRDGGFGHFFISLGVIPFLISIFLSVKNREKIF